MVSDARRAATVLADLAPSGRQRSRERHHVTDHVPLPLDAVRFLRMPISRERTAPLATGDERAGIVDMVKRARLHGEEADLRVGWLWLIVPVEGGQLQRVPLISARVDAVLSGSGIFLDTVFGSISLARTGDLELTGLVTDDDVRDRLEDAAEFGGGAMTGISATSLDHDHLHRLTDVTGWAVEVAKAAGHPTARVVTAEPASIDRPVVVAQLALYLRDSPRESSSAAEHLRAWARLDIERTAFAEVYTAQREPEAEPSSDPVRSSLALSPAQRSVVQAVREAPIVVVSGPPGSGKSQTVVAAALDAVERGRSVLVAAPSEAAVEALTTLLTDTPGPDPVVFGDNARRVEVAERLGHGGGELVDRRQVDAARDADRRAEADWRTHYDAVSDALRAEQRIESADPILTFRARQIAPGWFDRDADLTAAHRLLAEATETTGWFASLRRARASRRLVDSGRATTDDIEHLSDALDIARSERSVEHIVASGGLELDRSFDRLAELDGRRREQLGRRRHAEAHDVERVDRRARATMGAVAAALRSGRAKRRRRLATIDGADMVRALPLWVGTLRDVDDLLPRTPGMFDLVIIDEASQVDQVQAAPALLRGRRAMIVGDPRQLRHVSFIGDDVIDDVMQRRHVPPRLRHLLDVRRMSAFDLGAATARTRMLDEHFRSTPHLIEFSARRFYDDRLHIATRHPSNHSQDQIAVERVGGHRDDDGVNHREVEVGLDVVADIVRRAGEGETVGSVGFLTPTRAQADRIEQLALARFDLRAIDAVRLRVGTVHGFQGCERDTTIISLGLDADSAPGSRSFIANPHLFNVMITRARSRIVVLTSLDDEDGLIGDYLRHADVAPSAPTGSPHPDRVVDGLAADLRRVGTPAITQYPAGRHTIDLVVGDGSNAVGVLFGVHRNGVDEHIERELTLRRLGWRTVSVFSSRWDDRIAELALELARIVRAQ